MPVIELRQRSRGYVELPANLQADDFDAYHSKGFRGPAAVYGAGGPDTPGGTGAGPGGGRHEDDGSDDDFSNSGSHANPWRRFRKTSRERLLRGFSPLRRTVAEAAYHPAAPKVYLFLCAFSACGILFLLPIARMLLAGSPYLHVTSHAGLSRREMGWVVVEAMSMYAFVLAVSGYAWYRHTRRRAQLGGGVMYTRLRGGGGGDRQYDPFI